jgi:hypothetical protein
MHRSEVSANLIFPIYVYCHNGIPHLEKIVCGKFSLLESVTVTEFQVTEAYSSLDLTKAKYSIRRLSMVENKNVSVRINPSSFIVREKTKINMMMKMEFTINMFYLSCIKYMQIF